VTLIDSVETIGPIPAGDPGVVIFSFTTDPILPVGTEVSFIISFSDNKGYNTVGFIDLNIGKVPVLVIDLDPNFTSGIHIKDKVQENNVVSEYVTYIPQDLSNYSSIFLCLGIYANNYILSAGEGDQFSDYLNNGGCMYMEGGDTWFFDSQTSVHPMFNIDPISDGGSDLDSLLGVGGVIQGMVLGYTGENSWIDRLGANPGAEIILNNNDPAYGSAVWYDEGSYKTIGASHEFGGIYNEPQAVTLIAEYLRFFGINVTCQWLGNNSNWNDPVNWNNGIIPDEETHVIIPANPSRGGFPLENDSGEAKCKSLKLDEGAILSVPDGTTMTIYE
jgi:hypothetical protein